MIPNKILISIKKLDEIEEYKKIGITNFLFALDGFSIGYKTFKLSELESIDANIYLLINRVMDTKCIDEFKFIVSKLNFVKGIFFEDMGVYQVLKDSNIPLIFNQTQFATNTKSINYFLEMMESAVVSNSLCEKEIIDITNNVDKPIVFNVFAKNMVMYSRRKLLSNYNKYFNLENRDEIIIRETFKGKKFLLKESEYGTVIFNDLYFNYLSILPKLNDNNILFYYINNLDLNVNDIKRILMGEKINSDDGFLNKKTIFKVGDIRD